ncbi:protein kinase [Candidatus Margulisiibacteriota bacterium]
MDRLIDRRYEVIGEIGRGGNSVVYKARDRQSQATVAIKVLSKQRRDAESILRFRKEAEIISKLAHPYVVKLVSYGEHEGSTYLAMELVEGKNLSEILKEANFSLEFAIDIISQIAEALEYVHERGIIHRDLKPNNIVLSRDKRQKVGIKVIDFCLARIMDLAEIIDREAVVGTFSYMSPEQAGTLPVLPDERSDLYSLGIIFYELLSGEVPFQGEDVSAILHQHVAREPKSLKAMKGDIPEIIDQMVMKLLKKAPEERYQSAKGLLSDLNRIRQMLKRKNVEVFTLGSEDRAGKLSYLIRFIGRQVELGDLITDYGLSKDGIGRVSLISGLSGMGKTKLVDEFRPYAEKGRGIFLSGKCNKYGATLPYSPFVEAITEYVEQVKRKPAARKEAEVKKITRALGELSGIITQSVPALEELIGEIPPLIKLDAEREKMRFFSVMQAFLNAVASQENPLVIFLDDLQWADLDTLELLRFLVPQLLLSYILMIGSFRAEEVASGHPLASLLKDLREEKIPFREINLRPFKREETAQVIEETFGYREEIPKELLDVIEKIAKGNPFYILQILRAMVDEKVISFKDAGWCFDTQKMHKVSLPTSLIELILGRIKGLKPEMKNILGFASVIGRDFDYEILASITKLPTNEILDVLDEAQRQMFIWIKPGLSTGSYVFSHDKIRETLYEKLREKERRDLHEEIARSLEEDGRGDIYELAHHYYEGLNKEKALYYSIEAGDRAKTVYANEEAIRFYERALSLLKEKGGKEGSQVWLKLKEGMGDAHCLLGEFDKSIECYEAVARYTETNLGKAKLLVKEGLVFFEKGDLPKAAEYYTRGLRFLNVKIPSTFLGTIVFLLQQILVQAAHTFFPFIYSAHKYKNDEVAKLKVRILFRLGYFYWFFNTVKCLAVSIHSTNMAEHIGPSKELQHNYSTHGFAMAVIPMYKRAFKFLYRSLAIAEEINDPFAKALSQSYLGLVCYSANQLDKSIDWLQKAAATLERLGDPWELFIAYSHLGFNYRHKSEFDKALRFFEISYDLARKVKDQRSMGQSLASICEVLAIKGEKSSGVEKRIIKAIELSKKSMDNLALAKALGDCAHIHMLYGELEQAVEKAYEGKRVIEKYFIRADYVVPTYLVLAEALLKLAERDGVNTKEGRQYLKKAWWPMQWGFILTLSFRNNLGYAYRVKGTYACLRGKKKKGQKYFNQSIKILEQQGNKYELGRTLAEAGRLIG